MIPRIIIIYSVIIQYLLLNRITHKTYLNGGTMQHQSLVYY